MAVAHPVAVETSVHKCVIRPPLFRASEEASLVEEVCRLSGSPRPPWNQQPVHAYVHETEEPHLLKQPLALEDRRIVCLPGLFIVIYPQPAKVTGSASNCIAGLANWEYAKNDTVLHLTFQPHQSLWSEKAPPYLSANFVLVILLPLSRRNKTGTFL